MISQSFILQPALVHTDVDMDDDNDDLFPSLFRITNAAVVDYSRGSVLIIAYDDTSREMMMMMTV